MQRFYRVISFFLVFFGLCLVLLSSNFAYLPVYYKKIGLNKYDGLSSDINLSKPKSFFDTQTINIHGKFILPAGDPNHPYSDLFQTDSYNNGIRYEFQALPDGSYTSGLVIKNDSVPESFSGEMIGTPPVHLLPNTPYVFNLNIDGRGHLNYDLSEVKDKTTNNQVASGEMKHPMQDYVIKHVIIGQGFDHSRKFLGVIEDFQMTYQRVVPGFSHNTILRFSGILLLLALGVFILSIEKQTIKTSAAFMLKIIGSVLSFIRNYSTSLALLFFILAIGLFSFSEDLVYLPIFSKTLNLNSYNGLSSDLKLSQLKKVHESHQFSNRSVQINGYFIPPSIDEKTPLYMDVFQTDSYNNGIRFELQPQPEGNYTAGIAIKTDRKHGNIAAFMIESRLTPMHRYKINIKIHPSGLFECKIFDFNQSKMPLPPLTVKLDDLNYNIKDVIIGAGFDETRQFRGKLQNFRISYQDSVHSLSAVDINWIATALFFIALGCVAYRNQVQINPKKSCSEIATYYLAAACMFLYPLLQLYSVNIINVEVEKILILCGALLASSFLLLSLFYVTYRNIGKALLFLVICTVYLFFTGRFYTAISFLISANLFIFISLLALVGLFFIVQCMEIPEAFISFIKKASYLLFLMCISSVLFYTGKSSTSDKSHQLVKKSEMEIQYKPDIYFIISDMHISQITSEKHLSDDKHIFISKLKSLGFFVANNAASNYAYTLLSIPSMLNLSYIPKEMNDAQKIIPYYDHNRLAVELKKMGYQYVFISPRGYIIGNSDIADVNTTCSSLSDFEGILWQYSLFFRANKFGNTYRNDIQCGIKKIKESALMPGPKFIFAHLLSPHPPYVFDRNGNPVPLRKQNDLRVSLTKVILNKDGYLNQMQFISKKLLEITQFILKHSKEPPIIIIQGDHGFSLYTEPDISSGKILPPDDNINARMRTLSAYYFPNGGDKVLYDSISPINMSRGLMRHYFGRKDLNQISDISYWSAETDLFQFIDVTKKIRQQDM